MNSFNRTILATSILVTTTSVSAGTIWGAVDATASSEWGTTYAAENTINQSGLSHNYISGVTDFDSFLAQGVMHELAATTEWFAQDGELNSTIEFDMGQVGTFDRFALWNEDVWGITSATISAWDGSSYVDIMSFNPIDNVDNANYDAEIFSFGQNITTDAFKIEMACQGSACSMGEFVVSSVPEPSVYALMLGGLGFVGFMATRRNKKA